MIRTENENHDKHQFVYTARLIAKRNNNKKDLEKPTGLHVLKIKFFFSSFRVLNSLIILPLFAMNIQ